MTTERMRTFRRRAHRLLGGSLAASCALWLVACGAASHDHGAELGDGHDDHAAAASWSITAWGSHFEIFPEVGALVAGETSSAHVHVTRLDGFAPLANGGVEIVLGSGPEEQVFRADAPTRPGVYDIDLTPAATGELDLAFRIETPDASEQIRGGRVRVGTAERSGGVVVAPAPKGGDGGEPLPLLKEEQWRSDFATSWVRRGELARGVDALVHVRPPAGGERLLSSPLDGVVHAAGAWPYPGRRIARGAPLFRIVPRVADASSLAQLEATASSFEIEKTALQQRLARLEELLALDATSRREVEEVRHEVEILDARHAAAESDLRAARVARRSGSSPEAPAVAAPFDGAVAAVHVTPGATLAAGEVLARVVRSGTVWLEALLAPADAVRLEPGELVRGLVLTPPGSRTPLELEAVRTVSVAPEASERTGKVTVFFEVSTEAPGAARELVLGTTMDGVILLAETRSGVVVPATALVDDGGVTVVYLQLDGESFLRHEVRVLERQGARVLVDGLEPGQRLVHRGGDVIRRSSLMSSGEAHGHVH
ncbi:MAG: HlyD family efflux transporter periplasmic adaptor subunit [Acidobacteriota bacterium]